MADDEEVRTLGIMWQAIVVTWPYSRLTGLVTGWDEPCSARRRRKRDSYPRGFNLGRWWADIGAYLGMQHLVAASLTGHRDPSILADGIQQSPVSIQCVIGRCQDCICRSTSIKTMANRITFTSSVLNVRFGMYLEVSQRFGVINAIELAQAIHLSAGHLGLLRFVGIKRSQSTCITVGGESIKRVNDVLRGSV